MVWNKAEKFKFNLKKTEMVWNKAEKFKFNLKKAETVWNEAGKNEMTSSDLKHYIPKMNINQIFLQDEKKINVVEHCLLKMLQIGMWLGQVGEVRCK